MKASEIRRDLLAQHAELRSLLDQVSAAAARAKTTHRSVDDARACLAQLLEALGLHNLREEELLRGLLPGVDAWGGARAEIMGEEHVAEHRDLHAALTKLATLGDAARWERTFDGLRIRLLSHLAREERDFLGADALHDEEPTVDAFGG
jgi:hypothetical protein